MTVALVDYDETLLLGLVARDLELLTVTVGLGLRPEHFRDAKHSDLFKYFTEYHHAVGATFDWEALRESADASDREIVRLARAAKNTTNGARIPDIISEAVRTIVGRIGSAQDRAQYLEQVFASCGRGDLGAADYLTATAIARRVNRKTGNCFPGYERLAKDTGQSVRTIEGCIPTLSRTGHLHVGKGRPVLLTPIVIAKLKAAATADDCDDDVPF